MKIRLALLLGAVSLALAGSAADRKELLRALPLRFEQIYGGSNPAAKYAARSRNFELRVGASENWLEWTDSEHRKSARIRTRLVGANPHARIEAETPLPGFANYLVGDKENWKIKVQGFGAVRSRGVYPGVDFVFHGISQQLEYDFIVGPHADPASICMEIDGHRGLAISAEGDLVISTDAGEIQWKRPAIYQETNGTRHSVAGRFAVDGRKVRFEIGDYDADRELVIDPVLRYSTYLGGGNNEAARGIAVDAQGNIYMAGVSSSADLPTTGSAYQPNFAGRTALAQSMFTGDGFVAKFSPSGSLMYLTYLGGSRDDGIAALAIDSSGNVYVTGGTNSTDFPIVNAYQSRFGGLSGNSPVTSDIFVAKLSPDGSKLLFSTYLGGTLDDIGTGIALDKSGNIFICGASASRNFPVMNPLPRGNNMAGAGGEPIRHDTDTVPEWEPGDAIVAEFNPSGQLLFATYLGGGLDDAALSIAVDSSSNVYVGGCTISSSFPTTTGAFQTSYHGEEVQNEFFNMGDGFVTKINPSNSSIVYSTFFGGRGDDCVTGIAIDSSGSVYMTGTSSSPDLPVTAGAPQMTYAGYRSLPFEIAHLFGDAFVAKLDPAGAKLQYLTYLGGSQNDGGTAIAVDSQGQAFVLGFSDSTNFPVTAEALQSKFAGDGRISQYLFYGDAFLAVVNPAGTALAYSTYLGGNFDERPFGIALDGNGSVYIAGNTVSTTFPVTSSAVQSKFAGFQGHANGTPRGDAFLTVISGFSAAAPAITSVTNAFGDSATLAPNTWVAIKGTNLASGARIWQDADFSAAGGRLPTALDGTSVKMNGKNAYVYYISGTQINVLTPSDLGSGQVQVQVSSGGLNSQVFTSQAQAQSISFFVFNGGPYIIATHLDGRLIGPTSLFPGASTPAKPGETIIIYANGFGPTNVPVTPGSITQSGTLASPPTLQIGTQAANVGFAGLISPGLFQFNVDIPATAANGDARIQCQYAGQISPAGTLITIQQ